MADTLDRGADARRIHESEHGFETLVRLANQIAQRGIEIEHGGDRSPNAHLVFDRTTGHGIARAKPALVIDQHLGNDEKRNAARAGRRTGQTRQHDVDDVVSQVVFTRRDKDLGSRDLVAAIGQGLGAGLDLRQIGTALRFGQAHGAGPCSRHQRWQVLLLLRLATVTQDGVDAAHAQARVHIEGPVGAAHHLSLEDVDRHRQALATIFHRERQTLPATGDKLRISGLETGRRRDHAIAQLAALLIARQAQRCEHFLAQRGRPFQDGLDHVGRGIGAVGQTGVMRRVVQHLVHQKAHIAQRGFVIQHA